MTYLQKSKIIIKDSQHVARVFLDLLALDDKIDQEKEHFLRYAFKYSKPGNTG